MTIKTDHGPKAPVSIPQTKPTGQKRSLERGKATRKKNPASEPGKAVVERIGFRNVHWLGRRPRSVLPP
jgi:hypothetical protein